MHLTGNTHAKFISVLKFQLHLQFMHLSHTNVKVVSDFKVRWTFKFFQKITDILFQLCFKRKAWKTCIREIVTIVIISMVNNIYLSFLRHTFLECSDFSGLKSVLLKNVQILTPGIYECEVTEYWNDVILDLGWGLNPWWVSLNKKRERNIGDTEAGGNKPCEDKGRD